MRGRPAAVGLERGLEPDPDRRHHPRGAPEERDQGDEPERGQRRGDLLDRALDVVLARRRKPEGRPAARRSPRPDLVVLENQPEDRDEQDRQRKEREEHMERDGGRVLGRRSRKRSSTASASARRPRPPRPPASERGERSARRLRGWGVLIARSVRSLLRGDRRRSSENQRRVRPSNTLSPVRRLDPFTVVVVATIAVNAVVLGLQTYDGLEERWGTLLDLLNAACLAVFIVGARDSDRRLLAAAVEVLPQRLEHLRLRRRHGRVRSRNTPELDVASPRPPAPRRSARAGAARSAGAPARRVAEPACRSPRSPR